MRSHNNEMLDRRQKVLKTNQIKTKRFQNKC